MTYKCGVLLHSIQNASTILLDIHSHAVHPIGYWRVYIRPGRSVANELTELYNVVWTAHNELLRVVDVDVNLAEHQPHQPQPVNTLFHTMHTFIIPRSGLNSVGDAF